MNKPLLLLLLLFFSHMALYPVLPAFPEYPTLDKQLDRLNLKDKSEVISLMEAYRSKGGGEVSKGIKMILLEEHYTEPDSSPDSSPDPAPDYALELFVHLLQNGAVLDGDPITCALALANNYLYSIGDEQTRKAVKADVLAHFVYYKKVLAWQKDLHVAYDSREVPLIPKIYWAYRFRTFDKPARGEKLDLKTYREFINTIESLETVHSWVRSLGVEKYQSLLKIAHIAEGFAKGENLCYRANIETHKRWLRKDPKDQRSLEALEEYNKSGDMLFYKGKERRWDHFYWLNYQIKRFQTEGRFKGDCITMTTIQMNLYKAMGIPAFANQIRSINPYFYHHNSPFYYNVFTRAWQSIQKPVEDEQGYYNNFDRPIWHHRLYEKMGRNYRKEGRIKVYDNWWPGEEVSYKEVTAFRRLGFQLDHFEKFFFSFKTFSPGQIFNKQSTDLNDTDFDGLSDLSEKKLGLNPRAFDSDNDGYGDLWEMESGFDPLDNKSPASQPQVPAMDGLAEGFITSEKMQSLLSPPDDYKAVSQIHDTKSISAKIIKNHIYIGVTFYNNILPNTRHLQTITIDCKGEKSKRYFIQWSNLYKPTLYEQTFDQNGKSRLEKIGQTDWEMAFGKEVEFLLPLSYFNIYDTLFIRYQSTGGLENGKRSNSADYSAVYRLELEENKQVTKILSRLEKAVPHEDKTGDPEGLYNQYDIKLVKAVRYKGFIAVYAEFANDIKNNYFCIHSIDIRNKNDKKDRWFFQTWRPNLLNLWRNDQKTQLEINAYDIIRLEKAMLIIIPASLIKGKNLEIRYRAGARDEKGKNVINSDLAGYFPLD